MLVKLLKKHIGWMLASYLVIGFLVNFFFLKPQRDIVREYQKEKDEREYEYLKITSPNFVKTLEETVTLATLKANDFFWLDREDIDRGLALYNHLFTLSKKSNVELLSVSADEKRSSSAKKTKEEELYYRWKVNLTGYFPDVISFIAAIENNRKFLIIYEISIQRSEHNVIYELTLLGLKDNSKESKK